MRTERGVSGRLERLWRRLSPAPPATVVRVLVYQPGKVGSVAIARSLREAGLGLAVDSAHVISPSGLRGAESFHRRLGVELPPYVEEGHRIAREIRSRKDVLWKVITAFRDPIARIVSGFFEDAARLHPGEFPAHGDWPYADVERHLLRALESFDPRTDYTTGWFDQEIRAVFGIDVLADDFDHESGFVVRRGVRAEVLVLKFEALESAFARGAGSFLGLERPIPLQRANDTGTKPHAAIYAETLRRLRIPREIGERIYATRFARRLYAASEREAFLSRWSEPSRPA